MGCHLYAAPHRIHRIHRSNLFLFFPRSLGTVSSFGRFSFGRFSFGRFSFGRFLSDGLFAPPPRLGTTEVEVGVCLGLFASWKTIIGRQGVVFEVCLVCQRCSGFCLDVPLLLRPGSAPESTERGFQGGGGAPP